MAKKKLQENKDAFDSVAKPQEKESAFQAGAKSQTEAVGSSGTEIFGGYFNEEFIDSLKGNRAAVEFDKMRRSEAQLAMLLAAVFNPIKAAPWTIEPFSQEPEHLKHAEFMRAILFDGIDFDTFKHEALTFVIFGHAVFEITHNVIFNHPKFGTFNGIASLGFRSQKTIYAWNLEKKTGRLLSLEQIANGDTAPSTPNTVMPGEFLLVLTNSKEGDNYEGISVLRPAFGAYLRKKLYLKLTAIGVEKYAVGTPIGTVPAGKEDSEDFQNFKKMLQAYTSHEKAYLIKPDGWNIDVQKVQFDADKIVELLKFENTEMVNAFVANFLALGTHGGGGSQALSVDLSKFFLFSIQAYADFLCGPVNRKLIPDMIKMNFGQQAGYPKLKITDINDQAGVEFSQVVSNLVGSKSLTPDEPLEGFIRNKYKMPKQDAATARQVDPKPLVPTDSTKLKLSEASTLSPYVEQFDKSKANVKALMQAELRKIADTLKKSLKTEYNAASTENKITIGPKLKVPEAQVEAYVVQLQNALAKEALTFLEQVKSEVPTKKKIKLFEQIDSLKLAAPQGAGYYDALPDHIKKLVQAQATMLADTQSADLEKVVAFQFTSSATATDDLETIEADIDQAVNKVIDGDTTKGMSVDAAAGDVVGHVATQARTEYFFDPEVFSEIESFTFENNDPVSEICQELAGTTFDKNDPQVDEYNPPLHHNCKSRMTANLTGASGNPEPIDGTADISDAAKKSMTLSEFRQFLKCKH